MTEPQEETVENTLSSLFGNTAVATKPEEPTEETTSEETTEAVTTEETTDPPSESGEPIVDESGRVVVKFDDDDSPDGAQTEDVSSLKQQIKALLEEKEKMVAPELDPRIAKLNEYVRQGGDINANVWELQTKDYSKVNIKEPKDALTVVKDKLKYVEGLEQDEIDFYLKKNYPITSGFEEELDEDDTTNESMKLRMEAKNALEPLKEFQDKVLLPSVDHNKSAEAEKAVSLYRAESSAKLDEIDSFDLELDADTKLKIPFTGAAKNFARSIITDPSKMSSFWNDRYTSEDGKVDFKRFAEEMYYLENRHRIKDAIYAQGKSVGKKAILEEIQGENGTSKLKQPSAGSTPKKTGLAAITF